MKLNALIDHTLLSPSATETDIINLCEEAKKHRFFSVCINGSFVELAKTVLKRSEVKVCSVVGFPLGSTHTEAKVFEAKKALEQGADEIDMVINIGFLKSGNYDAVAHDIVQVKNACGRRILKVIIETCELTKAEIITASEICVKAGADYVKTSTGFGKRGATLADVKIIKKTIKNTAKIKASGGIRDFDSVMQYLKLGVDRIGTSSGVKIMKQGLTKEV